MIRRRPLLSPLVLATCLAALALVAAFGYWSGSADAAEGLIKAEVTPTNTQAGGHPDVKFLYEWRMRKENPKLPCHCDDARTIVTDTPTGFIGNPHALPTCTLDEFSLGECPEEAQVGFFGIFEGDPYLSAPAYNVVSHPDQAGLIAFKVPILDVPVFLDISARTESDYGLVTTAGPIYHPLPIPTIVLTLWGVPADPSHDGARFKTPLTQGCLLCAELGAHSNAPLRPYLQNPTTCGVPLSSGVTVEYYTGNSVHADLPFPTTTGCDSLSFNPSLTAQPTTTQADTASGIDINLKVPQTQSPSTPAPSEIRSSTVTLPVGFSVNPSAADGKVACNAFESAIGLTRGPATCLEFSKIGTLNIDSSALPGPIPGAVYLGEPRPGDRYRIILAADGFGTHVKLAGSVRPDPQTGQLIVSFPELPQSPLSEFDLHIFGSERGLLATPTHCGSYPVVSEFVPWDANLPNQSSTSFFSITSGPNGGPCPDMNRPFDPALDAGTANATAGMHSPFSLKVTRNDGDQNLVGLNVSAPPGFAATLRGIPYCPQAALERLVGADYSGIAEIGSPACPAASQIGTAVAGAGAGTHPLYVDGRVYLAGPYKGAPLSLEAVVPAVSGPYDLGVVAVRAAIFVDPATAEVTTVSDPLPQIVAGIPLRTRSIDVKLDRPDFTLNPTNCDPFSVDAAIFGNQGAVAGRSNHFQVANCGDLSYAPKLTISLTGGVKRRGHPAIHAVLKTRPGEANTRSISVALPKGELLDNAHLGTICTRPAFAGGSCPAGSLLGTATAVTPLLDKPLEGNVYLRSNPAHELPDLVVDLKGQIDVEVAGTIDTVKGGSLRTTFAAVPDAPVSEFTLDLAGGGKGLLQNSTSLCGKARRAEVRMVGQSGAAFNTAARLQTSCGTRARHRSHRDRRHHRAGEVG